MMMAQDNPYREVWVESFRLASTDGLPGPLRIRPVAGQGLPEDLFVECGKRLLDYPEGTRFLVRAKLTDREGGGRYLYSSWQWRPLEVVEPGEVR
jgi:hypothetical protein